MEVMCPNLMKGWMFAGGDVRLNYAVLMNLDLEIFQVGDIIIHQNSSADKMYFIKAGRVREKTRFFQREFSPGDCFGGGV